MIVLSPRQRRALTWAGVLAALSAAATLLIVRAGGGAAAVAALGDLHRALAGRPHLMLAAFALWALVANCLVVPAGSVSLLAGGALLGWAGPAAVWFLAQLATAPWLHRLGTDSRSGRAAAGRLGRDLDRWLALAARDGVLASMLLRVIPVVPSAPAALIAGGTGIGLSDFMVGSALAGWLRPVYFASLGAGLSSLAGVEGAAGVGALAPLALAAVALAGVLAVRLWLGGRTDPQAGEQRR